MEYSLSLGNLFIFVLLISRSAVPRELHSRVLLLGVALALLLGRAIPRCRAVSGCLTGPRRLAARAGLDRHD